MLIHRKLVLRMHDDDLIPKLFTIWNAFLEMSNETFLYTVNEEDTFLQKDFRGVRDLVQIWGCSRQQGHTNYPRIKVIGAAASTFTTLAILGGVVSFFLLLL